MTLWALAAVIAAAAAVPGAASEPARVEPAAAPCPSVPQVGVRAAVAADAHMACDGVLRALAFLARLGLDVPPSTTIDIVPRLPGDLGGRAVGCYLRDSRSILLLSFDAFRSGGPWFGMPPDEALYTAAAAHEMAHAVVGCHVGPAPLPVAAHEYLAYVVLFATLAPELRERLLARFPGKGFSSTLQINDINHIAQPNQFAVDAWRHYLRRPDRDAWLRQVIAGQVVQDLFGDGP